MTQDLRDAIISGRENISLVVSAADLKKVMTAFFREEAERTEAAIAESREKYALPPKTVASMLKVTASTLWRWERSGYLTPSRIGKKVLYRQSDIDRLLSNKK